MVSISFTKFRQHAKDYFDCVEKGKAIRILRHGKIIAEIVPPQRTSQQRLKSPQMTIPGVSLSKAILKERKSSHR